MNRLPLTNAPNPGSPSHSDPPSDRSDRVPDGAGYPSKESNSMVPLSESPGDRSSGGEGRGHFPPNLVALAILEHVRERQKDRRETDPSRTQELIREARARGVHGYEPTE